MLAYATLNALALWSALLLLGKAQLKARGQFQMPNLTYYHP